jgi:uncharacterized protein (DUF1778 family)
MPKPSVRTLLVQSSEEESPMAPKSERFTVRVDPVDLDAFTRAARLERLSVSEFVIRAVRAEADDVLTREDRTLMPLADFERLLATLDTPDEAPRLAEAFRAARLAR